MLHELLGEIVGRNVLIAPNIRLSEYGNVVDKYGIMPKSCAYDNRDKKRNLNLYKRRDENIAFYDNSKFLGVGN